MSRVLLLGLKAEVVEAVRREVSRPGLEVLAGTGAEALRAAIASGPLHHLVMGGGLPLETRLALVRELFELSQTTTVHLKDVASGPEGYLPFVRGVLAGGPRATTNSLQRIVV